MSLANSLIKKIENLPYERLKHSISFKESQYERLRHLINGPKKYDIVNKKPSVKELIFKKQAQIDPAKEKFTETQLKQMIAALDSLKANKFKTYYEVGDKLNKPAGNPEYYQRLLSEIKGEGKETWISAIRTVVFGK